MSARRRGLLILLALYGVALAASHVVRRTSPTPEPALGPAQLEVELSPVGGEVGDGVRLVYEDHGPSDAPVLVCVHGSPGSLGDFRAMIPELSGEVRVITLDLPGFGKSEQVVPDYSVAAHAAYLVELLDRQRQPSVEQQDRSSDGIGRRLVDRDVVLLGRQLDQRGRDHHRDDLEVQQAGHAFRGRQSARPHVEGWSEVGEGGEDTLGVVEQDGWPRRGGHVGRRVSLIRRPRRPRVRPFK